MPTHNKTPDSPKPLIEGKTLGSMSSKISTSTKRPIKSPPKPHKTTGPLDLVNYHDVVKIIENHRPHNVKMVVIHDDQIIEKVLNKIRTDLKILKKGE